MHTVVFGTDPIVSLLGALARSCDADDHRTAPPRLLIVIDQFERFFSRLLDHNARTSILASLVQLTDRSTVLISLRADRLSACRSYPVLAEAVERGAYELVPAHSEELRSVVTDAVLRNGAGADSGLDEVIVTALTGNRGGPQAAPGEPGEISLMSCTLKAIWREREAGRLTIAGFRRIGGVAGPLYAAADAIWEQLTPTQQPVAKQILLSLVSVCRDADDSRRRLPISDLRRLVGADPASEAVLDRFVDAHLVTMDRADAYLGHELLLRWPRLARWIEKGRPTILVRRQTAVDAAEWVAAERHTSLLYRGIRLSVALEHMDTTDHVAVEFLRESCAAERVDARL